jgi:zinc protease
VRRVAAIFAACVALWAGPRVAAQQPEGQALPPPPVPVGPPPQLVLPRTQSFTISNGLPVRLLEIHALPVVQVDLVLLSGAASESLDRAGVADLTADLLDEGTETRDALEIAERLEVLGAQLATGAGWDASFVTLHVAPARLDSALTIMADVVLHPSFPDRELARKRTERLTAFLQARDVPAVLASTALAAALYPQAHRYHLRTGGTAATVGRLSRDDLLGFYRQVYSPSNAALVVAGDVTAESLRPALEAAFGSWRGPIVQRASLPPAPQVEKTRVVLVDRPGSEQSEIRVARVGPPRTTEDYVRLEVLDTLLGGSFTSRLNANLRETHGYTYGAGSVVDWRLGPGPVLAGAAVHSAVTDSSVAEFLKELGRIRDEPPTSEETERAERYVALSLPAEFETTRDVAERVAEQVVYDLPDDFYDTFVRRVLEVTPEQIQETARRYLDPDASLIVVVGDAANVAAGLARLGVASVERRSVEQVMGPPPRLAGGGQEGSGS